MGQQTESLVGKPQNIDGTMSKSMGIEVWIRSKKYQNIQSNPNRGIRLVFTLEIDAQGPARCNHREA